MNLYGKTKATFCRPFDNQRRRTATANIDDESSIRLTLETDLSLRGFRISSTSSGREAVALLKTEKFDAVICDVVMPDGDGLSVVRGLRVELR